MERWNFVEARTYSFHTSLHLRRIIKVIIEMASRLALRIFNMERLTVVIVIYRKYNFLPLVSNT